MIMPWFNKKAKHFTESCICERLMTPRKTMNLNLADWYPQFQFRSKRSPKGSFSISLDRALFFFLRL